MARLVTILGATGRQGGSVVEAFVKDPAYKVRAVARNPDSAGGRALAAKGAEVVKGDLLDVASLKEAFKGANVVYAVTTDFWSMLSVKPPAGKSILDLAYETELQQGKNIIEAVLTIVDTTLETFILSSLSASKRISGGKYKQVLHFDGKAEAVDIIERDYPELAKKTLVLQLGLFMSNWRGPTPIRPTKQPDGSFEIGASGSSDALHPFVNPDKDTAIFVRALAALPPQKALKRYMGYGSKMSLADWAALWGKQNGVQAYYKDLTFDEQNERIPWLPGLGREMGEMWAYSAEFGYYGPEEGQTKMLDLDLERPVTTIEEYVKTEDFSPLFGPGATVVGLL